jgi:hypothetical protein
MCAQQHLEGRPTATRNATDFEHAFDHTGSPGT